MCACLHCTEAQPPLAEALGYLQALSDVGSIVNTAPSMIDGLQSKLQQVKVPTTGRASKPSDTSLRVITQRHVFRTVGSVLDEHVSGGNIGHEGSRPRLPIRLGVGVCQMRVSSWC